MSRGHFQAEVRSTLSSTGQFVPKALFVALTLVSLRPDVVANAAVVASRDGMFAYNGSAESCGSFEEALPRDWVQQVLVLTDDSVAELLAAADTCLESDRRLIIDAGRDPANDPVFKEAERRATLRKSDIHQRSAAAVESRKNNPWLFDDRNSASGLGISCADLISIGSGHYLPNTSLTARVFGRKLGDIRDEDFQLAREMTPGCYKTASRPRWLGGAGFELDQGWDYDMLSRIDRLESSRKELQQYEVEMAARSSRTNASAADLEREHAACRSSAAYKFYESARTVRDAWLSKAEAQAELERVKKIENASGTTNAEMRYALGARVVDSDEVLEREWPVYKSLGGKAQTVESVVVGNSPC